MTERDAHVHASDSPKRILSIDGGGVRGVVALAFLERLEQILQERYPDRSDFRLAQYFDLIGGTSTGAIIATGLALGFKVADLIDIYLNLSAKGFQGSRWHGGLLVPKFHRKPLLNILHQYLGDTTLGSDQVRTGLAIVAKRLDTSSVWIFHNHPNGPYFDPDGRFPDAVPNKDFPLINLVRASAAAPTYFAPERIQVASGVEGVFVDGGVSPFTDPSLLLMMLAGIKGYGFRWPLGEDRCFLLSVGTGRPPASVGPVTTQRTPSMMLALLSLRSLLQDTRVLSQTMLQWMGRCLTPQLIDSEMGDLADDNLGGANLLTFARYDLELSVDWLASKLGMTVTPARIASLVKMDLPGNVPVLLQIARGAAEQMVTPEHFPANFDRLSV